jgi:hypothetical protein
VEGSSHGRRLALRWAALAIALALVPSLALASTVSSGERTLTAPGTDHVRTDCGEHQIVTGGGFSIDPNGITASSGRSRPPGKSAWESQVYGLLAPASHWRNFAVCDHGGRRTVSIATETEPIERFGALASAKCAKARHVIGGGYAVRPPRNPAADSGSTLRILRSARGSRRTWKVFGVGDLPSDGKLTAYAICERNGRGGVGLVSRRAALHEGTNELAASCPAGRHMVSGGFSWFGADALPYESRPDSHRAWRAAVVVAGPPDSDGFLKVIAYCKTA